MIDTLSLRPGDRISNADWRALLISARTEPNPALFRRWARRRQVTREMRMAREAARS